MHMTACDVLRCAEQLNYTYEGEPPQVKEYCLKFIISMVVADRAGPDPMARASG